MPRIELIPIAAFEVPSPTMNICKLCAEALDLQPGDKLSDITTASEVEDNNGELVDTETVRVGSTDVEHPPYESGGIASWRTCAICQAELTQDDN